MASRASSVGANMVQGPDGSESTERLRIIDGDDDVGSGDCGDGEPNYGYVGDGVYVLFF